LKKPRQCAASSALAHTGSYASVTSVSVTALVSDGD